MPRFKKIVDSFKVTHAALSHARAHACTRAHTHARARKNANIFKVIAKTIMNTGDLYRQYHDVEGGTELDKFCSIRMGSAIYLVESVKLNRAKLDRTIRHDSFHEWCTRHTAWHTVQYAARHMGRNTARITI